MLDKSLIVNYLLNHIFRASYYFGFTKLKLGEDENDINKKIKKISEDSIYFCVFRMKLEIRHITSKSWLKFGYGSRSDTFLFWREISIYHLID